MKNGQRLFSPRASLLAGLLLANFVWCCGQEAQAQPGNPYIRRTNFPNPQDQPSQQQVDELLRTLIENQVQQRQQGTQQWPGYNNPVKPDLNIRGDELVTVRRSLTDFALEADRLTNSLTNDARVAPAVRSYISEVLKVRARATVLSERSATTQDIRQIIPEFQTLDQSWRLLAFQLSQVRGLSSTSLQSVQKMNEQVKTLGRLLSIDPQLNRTELLRQTASLATGIHALLEDVKVELGSSPQVTGMLIEGRKLEQEAYYLSTTVTEQYDYQTIVAEYKRFQTAWNNYAAQLWPLQNRYIERSIRRVQDVDNRVRELLWMPNQLNQQEILQATTVLKRDVDTFFLRAPLKLLIELPRGGEVIPSADQFFGVCQNFTDVVSRNEPVEEILDAFHYIEDAWREFQDIFRPMKSQAAHQVLDQIDQDMIALRNMLGINSSSGSNTQQLVALAASLETLADHLDQDMQRWLRTSRAPFRAQAMKESTDFAQAARRFNLKANSTFDMTQLRAECLSLLTSWHRLYGYIEQCDTQDRYHLQTVAARMSPVMVELRTMLVR